MAITAAQVKQLREMTGSGMMACKKALEATDGDMDKAIEYLREKGLAAAQKKAARIAAEGMSFTEVVDGDKKGVILEVNSESDFVAKNEKFQNYVKAVADQLLESEAADVEAFLEEPWKLDPQLTVAQELSEQISVIGEKLSIRRFEKLTAENGCVVAYLHGGGRIAVLVQADTEVVNDEVKEALKNVAMQIAALKPLYIGREDVDQDFIEKERAILKQQAMNENPGKPENIIDKMIIGRLNKELKDFCLLEQPYVKDNELTVAKYLQKVGKDNGTAIVLKKYFRFESGEGMQHREENFAEEVANQMNK